MKTKRIDAIAGALAVLFCVCALLEGCSSARRDDENVSFNYKEPKLPPLEEPELVERHRYLSITPSGILRSLTPQKIAIVAVPEFQMDSDARSYLRTMGVEAKKKGYSYLPYHYYIAPDGKVYEGQYPEQCGYLAGRRNERALLVGVLGDFDDPTLFLPEEQETALIQTCAWLCRSYSLPSQDIVPATEVDPNAKPLGVNLANWFGPTDPLRDRVDRTLQQGKDKKEKKEPRHPFYRGEDKREDFYY